MAEAGDKEKSEKQVQAPDSKKPATKYKISLKLTDDANPVAAKLSVPELSLEEDDSDEIPLEKSNRRIYWFGFFILLIVFAATGGVFYFRTRVNFTEEEEPQVAEEEVVEEIVPTPPPSLQLTRKEISLDILNGSGVAGLAGETADDFEGLGYTIGEVDNAASTAKSQVYINPKVEGKVDVLLDDLVKQLDIASVSGELSDSSASARIILGRE